MVRKICNTYMALFSSADFGILKTLKLIVCIFTADTLLMHYKSLDRGGFDSLEESLRRYIAEIPASDNTETNVHLVSPTTSSVSPIAGTATSHRVGWKVSSSACPLYLLGRYRKLARDVPQSAWTVATSAGPGGGGGGDGDGDGGGDDDEMRLDSATGASSKAGTGSSALGLGASESNNRAGSSNGGGGGEGATTHQQYRRKGRSSVEEIINSAVKAALLAADCRMHPCGREDIDVRCLGAL